MSSSVWYLPISVRSAQASDYVLEASEEKTLRPGLPISIFPTPEGSYGFGCLALGEA
ncbi:MAG: hypothetical protein AAGA66_03915 [Bacteroidota bacterium]